MVLTYFIGLILTFVILSWVKKVEFTVFKSEIQPTNWLLDDLSSIIVLSILWPYTIYKIYNIKKINMKKIVLIGAIVVFIGYLLTSVISVSNRDRVLRNSFDQKINERTAFYDKMFKKIAQNSEIALTNDSSFQRVVNIQVTGQKNGDKVMWAWVQQSNPTATYEQVASMYRELGLLIDGEREGFFEQERQLQSVKNQHDNLVDIFPGSMIMSILGRDKILYHPITSDVTEEVIKTGKDNNVKLFGK